jgi:hypothetical protein
MSILDWWNKTGRREAEERRLEQEEKARVNCFMDSIETLIEDIWGVPITVEGFYKKPTFEAGIESISITFRVKEG